MTCFRIAVLAGDGIGPEVMDAALQVLRSAGGPTLECTPHEFGAAHYRRTGEAFPQAVVDDCLKADVLSKLDTPNDLNAAIESILVIPSRCSTVVCERTVDISARHAKISGVLRGTIPPNAM